MPGARVDGTLIVMLEVPVPPEETGTEFAEKVSSRPGGEDEAERLTLPVNPLLVTVIMELLDSATFTLTDDGLAEMPKSPLTMIVTLTE